MDSVTEKRRVGVDGNFKVDGPGVVHFTGMTDELAVEFIPPGGQHIVIAFSGLLGCGKSTLSNRLKDALLSQVPSAHVFQISFATALKDFCADVFYRSVQLFTDKTYRDTPCLQAPWRLTPATPRHVLQFMGTDLCRKHMGVDVWVNALQSRVKQLTCPHYILIDDVRFPNEARWVTSNPRNLLIRLIRNDLPETEHESEKALKDYQFPFQMNITAEAPEESLSRVMQIMKVKGYFGE